MTVMVTAIIEGASELEVEIDKHGNGYDERGKQEHDQAVSAVGSVLFRFATETFGTLGFGRVHGTKVALKTRR